MDKILAFSILSSSPADIAGAGYASRLSWRSRGGKQATEKKQQEDKVERSPRPERKREARPARFAPEFDGLNCFEYIVSY
ncbi:hypothetical protein CFC21_107041 [Triticum aestivum]|uniref:Uncharacterized protein n=3 Tax=Triticinae TaxID=1648030 RepID=A0A453QK29_AEGTS|nr:uncharacterized protein LOC120967837 [Aegilops tauschii subsp. strangulata]XP_044443616.1 uncharacterized protein LOC123169809 [Triticum aestivum]KAF7106302.1 hypothetical protein CFC21_107041 [Triticum aestivum]